jgi:hypothetical protein
MTPATRSLRISQVGLRGIVGSALTANHVLDFASAFGTFLEPGGCVIVGRDPRASGVMMREGLLPPRLFSTPFAASTPPVVSPSAPAITAPNGTPSSSLGDKARISPRPKLLSCSTYITCVSSTSSSGTNSASSFRREELSTTTWTTWLKPMISRHSNPSA